MTPMILAVGLIIPCPHAKKLAAPSTMVAEVRADYNRVGWPAMATGKSSGVGSMNALAR
jgi:hypothetical protein